ncbi:MAG: hypothetical protein ACPG3V_03695 [Porticoccaceae bacterium]
MKNCHLLRHKIATFTFLSLIALEASTGWATTIQGNLEIKARSGFDTAYGDLTVEGNTRFEGDTTLGSQASETMTINGSITAKNNLTVDGDLKIQSVDSGSNGVVINIDNNSDNDTIPTTQAVKDYIDSTTPVSLYHSNTGSDSTSYSFKKTTNSNLWRLTTKDGDPNNNVSKQIFPGERLIYTVHFDRSVENEDDNAEIILSTVPCNDFDEGSGHRKGHEEHRYAYNSNTKKIAVLSYYKRADELTETLNFCAWFWKSEEDGARTTSMQQNFDVIYVHIAKLTKHKASTQHTVFPV